MATWHTIETARAEWIGAPKGDDTLSALLDVSRGEVTAYAPALDPADTEPLDPEFPDGEQVQTVPAGYRWAHLAHARNIWNAQNTNPSGAYGSEENFALTPFPMDWAIKARLRPTVLFGGVLA